MSCCRYGTYNGEVSLTAGHPSLTARIAAYCMHPLRAESADSASEGTQPESEAAQPQPRQRHRHRHRPHLCSCFSAVREPRVRGFTDILNPQVEYLKYIINFKPTVNDSLHS
jgi:hypothetical protein